MTLIIRSTHEAQLAMRAAENLDIAATGIRQLLALLDSTTKFCPIGRIDPAILMDQASKLAARSEYLRDRVRSFKHFEELSWAERNR